MVPEKSDANGEFTSYVASLASGLNAGRRPADPVSEKFTVFSKKKSREIKKRSEGVGEAK